jgi:hypothetical protein
MHAVLARAGVAWALPRRHAAQDPGVLQPLVLLEHLLESVHEVASHAHYLRALAVCQLHHTHTHTQAQPSRMMTQLI